MFKLIFPVVLTTLVSCGALNLTEIKENLDNATDDITYGVASAGTAIVSAVAKPVLEQCSNLKELLGLSYTEIEDSDREPDFSELTIDFMSRDYNVTYNISTAANDILSANFYNTSQKLYLFIHGWNTNPTESTYQQIKNALYADGKNNVLALDSSKYIEGFYLHSSTYVVFIGQKLAEVLVGLNEEGLSRENIHMIGHSLGAHIAGFAGKTFFNYTSNKIGRISGLDPAGPCFTEMATEHKLSSSCAEFVDVVHSNAGLLGIAENVGHKDFWPNGGASQPGCGLSCNHGRSVTYYAESITSAESFAAAKCGSWKSFENGDCNDGEIAYMGFGASPDGTNGTYYLRTAGSSPFGLGTDGAES